MFSQMERGNISGSSLEELYLHYESSPAGLTEANAAARLKSRAKPVKNESRFRKESRLLLRQFLNPLVLLLAFAVILSALLGESSDAVIILFILLTTGLLGFWQELSAGRAFESLKKLIETKHTVMRGGKAVFVTSAGIVPGDVLVFDAGDIIPADCRIIESVELHVNESSLTGESYPVEKNTGTAPDDSPLTKKYNCLWQGTNVISGTARALAINTGDQTVFGQMAHSLTQIPETAFEKGIKRFGYFLLRITLVLALIILVANLYFKKPLFDAVLFSLALAVGMAPELLPAIMTFAMSAGARRMMKKKVIVKKLSSIFNFGEVNILCTDKTGTITEGNVKVRDILDANGDSKDEIRRYAFLSASLQNGFSNPIDEAIASLPFSLDGCEKINEIPYDFLRKRLSIAVKMQGRKLIISKGAFSNIMGVCTNYLDSAGAAASLNGQWRDRINEKFVAFSREGYRVLGLAVKEFSLEKMTRTDEQQMVFAGFILLEDPLKESAGASIQKLRDLHIGVKIITGDNVYAAAHASSAIGMSSPSIISGAELNKLSPEALDARVRSIDVFAETEPHQKERIIRALQKAGGTVAYIGDGINDVAAINSADIGISTNNAVDVAKEAADFVLLEKDLSVLADGVYEGRKSFVNSMKYVFITTGATFGNMFSVAGASLFLPFLPMLPKQILLTNLVTDLPFLTIASDHVDEEQLRLPGRWNLRLIRNFMIVFGLHSSLFDFITFYVLYSFFHLSGSAFQTGWFLESAITELLILFIIRTRKSFLKSRPGKLLLVTALIAFLITALLPVSPFAGVLGFSVAHSRLMVAIAIILVTYFITADLVKIIFFRISDRRANAIQRTATML
jgi:Mg2+-importing ATPase